MKLDIQIRSIHCVCESQGLGSDEIGFFLAAVPVAKTEPDQPQEWTYTRPDERSYRIRWATGVDDGEIHEFEHPIQITYDADRSDEALEIIMLVFEVDGVRTTARQSRDVHDYMRDRIERHFLPGERIGTYDPVYSISGDRLRIGSVNALDVWHVDVAAPLEGTIDWTRRPWWNLYIWTPETPSGDYRTSSFEFWFDRRSTSDTDLIERRKYQQRGQVPVYEVETIYTLTP